MQWRLMRENTIKNSFISFALEKIYPYSPQLQASSSLIPRIRKRPIFIRTVDTDGVLLDWTGFQNVLK